MQAGDVNVQGEPCAAGFRVALACGCSLCVSLAAQARVSAVEEELMYQLDAMDGGVSGYPTAGELSRWLQAVSGPAAHPGKLGADAVSLAPPGGEDAKGAIIATESTYNFHSATCTRVVLAAWTVGKMYCRAVDGCADLIRGLFGDRTSSEALHAGRGGTIIIDNPVDEVLEELGSTAQAFLRCVRALVTEHARAACGDAPHPLGGLRCALLARLCAQLGHARFVVPAAAPNGVPAEPASNAGILRELNQLATQAVGCWAVWLADLTAAHYRAGLAAAPWLVASPDDGKCELVHATVTMPMTSGGDDSIDELSSPVKLSSGGAATLAVDSGSESFPVPCTPSPLLSTFLSRLCSGVSDVGLPLLDDPVDISGAGVLHPTVDEWGMAGTHDATGRATCCVFECLSLNGTVLCTHACAGCGCAVKPGKAAKKDKVADGALGAGKTDRVTPAVAASLYGAAVHDAASFAESFTRGACAAACHAALSRALDAVAHFTDAVKASNTALPTAAWQQLLFDIAVRVRPLVLQACCMLHVT